MFETIVPPIEQGSKKYHDQLVLIENMIWISDDPVTFSWDNRSILLFNLPFYFTPTLHYTKKELWRKDNSEVLSTGNNKKLIKNLYKIVITIG